MDPGGDFGRPMCDEGGDEEAGSEENLTREGEGRGGTVILGGEGSVMRLSPEASSPRPSIRARGEAARVWSTSAAAGRPLR